MADDSDIPSDTVLNEIAGRSLKFVGAVSTNRGIRAVLALRGYNQASHEQGWQLTIKASGYRRQPPVILESPEAAKAIATIDQWDEPTFRIARAALSGEFNAQRDFLFDNLTAQTGAASVVSVTTFLNRLDLLEHGKDRKATREADHAALAKLAERGITKDERARMRKLLEIAEGPSAAIPVVADAPLAEDDEAAAKEQRAAKIALWRWFSEWSEIARADIKRRDWLIQLGLAKRKARKKADGEGGDK
jgi:hypothetical protein